MHTGTHVVASASALKVRRNQFVAEPERMAVS